MTFPSFLRISFALLLLFTAAACDRDATPATNVPEVEDPAYKQGKDMLREGNKRGALEKFQQVIDARNGNAPDSQLDAGLICIEEENPIEAVYHFRQFLRFRPHSDQDAQVNELIQSAEKKFLQKIPLGRAFEDGAVPPDFEKKLRAVLRENDTLKRRTAALEKQVQELTRAARQTAGAPVPAAVPLSKLATGVAVQPPPPPPPPPVGIRKYVVRSGDTLSKISAKFYGTSTRYRDIVNANHDQLPSENAKLKVGMELTIPQ